ncbi:hypothetical protein [Helicobacter muridarum]|uniref:Adenine-specific DNA methyltransferase n=1 Tax=Helicobacter muridarum TaxID=216 RepID=A0A377PV28_9HELI|nr:hypothetical protein [Helicobacter muridarum]STQ86828.1 adenine-specific DNA methyltransferase [Helicobacter muridarum]
MARNEVETDSWVRDLLKEAQIPFKEQKGGTEELDNAFKLLLKPLMAMQGIQIFAQ